jgi:CNT family concentrative nucleoside transporter
MSDVGLRLVSFAGMAVLIGVAWLTSTDRRHFPRRIVVWGLGLQFALALLLLHTPLGSGFFVGMNRVVAGLIGFTDAGSRFVFGSLLDGGFSFVLEVLPIIVFMGSVFAILYHVGLVQLVVRLLARVLSHTMGTSGAESLAAVANIFVGMTEAPLLVRPYIASMTRSELFTLMTTGMATIAGSVLVAYAKMLGEAEFSGHLVIASLLSAPAAILFAKVIVPETDEPLTLEEAAADVEQDTVNWIDAASQGALSALRLAANIGALLLAFVALIALANGILGGIGGWFGMPDLTLERILGLAFAPFALVMGIAPAEATTVGSLLGVKTVLNEFLAYQQLSVLMGEGALSHRSAVIASYALCGFANFGSLAILIGGIGGIAPSRRSDVAALGMRSIWAGTLATLLTGCLVGVLL